MKVQTVLYYRYLFRQSIILLVTSFIISLIISLILFIVKQELMFQIIGGLIWIFPLIFLITNLIFLFKYKNYYQNLQNKELFYKMTNKKVRELVVKSGKRIKVFIPEKNQSEIFFNIIQPELERQKQIVNIIRKQK